MPSITEAKTNLPELAERLRAVASALRHLSTDHPCFSEDMKALREETQAIVARLCRPDQSEQGDSPAYSKQTSLVWPTDRHPGQAQREPGS